MITDYQSAYQSLLSLTNLHTPIQNPNPRQLSASLSNTKTFLRMLAPRALQANFIHVGGTSGKGSTTTIIHHILHQTGHTVGSYLSPHTTTYLERFQFNENLIPAKTLTKNIQTLHDKYTTYLTKGNTPLSFFELSTALAIATFHNAGANWIVLEVGCGGEYDATNLIPTPRVAVLTNIDKDHTALLGNSLAAIARTKAGIIKSRGQIVIGETRPSLKSIFNQIAAHKNATVHYAPKAPNHLTANATLAHMATSLLGIQTDQITTALASYTPLPCRFEYISQKPLIILDGAHSPAKIISTCNQIASLPKKPHVLFACTQTKNASDMIKTLSSVAASITPTRFTTTFKKAASPTELHKHIPHRLRKPPQLDPHLALKTLIKTTKKDEPIVITGSLYLAGELRSNWITEHDIVTTNSSFPI